MQRDPERLKEFWRMAYRSTLVRGVPNDKAEDAAQQLVLEVPGTVLEGSPTRWRRWLRCAARNVHIDLLRRTNAEKRALGEWFQRGQGRSSPVPVSDEDTERLVRAVGETISRLGDDERHVLWLRYGLQYTSREVAEELGVDQEVARKRLDRARDRFREIWNSDLCGEGSQ